MAVKAYDPDREVIYFSGVRVTGWADGEFLTYEPMSPAFASVVGTDGEVARSRNVDPRWKIVIKLLQTSTVNLAFSAIHTNDQYAQNGAGIGTILIQDLNGNTILKASQAWITKFPSASLDRTAKPREWELEAVCDTPGSIVEGGNAAL